MFPSSVFCFLVFLISKGQDIGISPSLPASENEYFTPLCKHLSHFPGVFNTDDSPEAVNIAPV